MNIILNVLQSILLPFALIPVLHFCAMPTVMGEFRTGRFWTITGPIISLAIIGINLFFVYDIIAGFEGIAAYVLTGIVAALYFANWVIHICSNFFKKCLKTFLVKC